MIKQDFISSPVLGYVILALLANNTLFKDAFKDVAPSIAADIESASTNVNCSCKNKVITYVTENNLSIGTFLYNYAITNNTLSDIEIVFANTSVPVAGQQVSGRVAKTTIKDWPDFAKNINEANFIFNHISTSIVGDDVYVFFL